MKYNIIYADPPWQYKDKCNAGKRGADFHYKTMKIKDIYNLPVNNIADKDCILFLWCTFPFIQEGLNTIKEWGFKYKTIGFNWIKLNKKTPSLFYGMGSYTRSNSEICLIGIKGKPKIISHSILSVLIQEREEHSKKPEIIRDKIVQLCGDLPRIELFARKKVDGWDCFGNEVEGGIEFE